jgi:hypothetical protein
MQPGSSLAILNCKVLLWLYDICCGNIFRFLTLRGT